MRVKMPDGTILDVPDGSTKQQVMALYEKQKPQPVSSVPNELSAGERILGTTRAGLEGMTLGFADELGLGAAAIPASIQTGEPYADVYNKMRQQYNRQQGEFERQNPKTALAANILGGLSTGGAGASKLLASPLMRTNPIKAASLLGATTGGVSGAGFAPTKEDIPQYSTTGAAAGAIFPPLLTLGGRAVSPLIEGAKKLTTLQTPQTIASKTLGKFAESDILPADEILMRMQQMGPQSTIADVGGENIKGLARTVGVMQGKGKEAAKNMFTERQSGSTARLMGSLKKLSGGDASYFGNMKRIITNNQKNASPYYKAAEQQTIEATDDLAEMFSRPSVKAALNKATRKAADEGKTIPKSIETGDILDFRTFDYTKRALDDKIGAAIRQGNADDARILTGLKNELLKIADDQIPDYKTARSIYSEGASNANAMELGKRILRDDFDEMADIVGNMSKTENEAFINGALKTIRDKLMTGKEDKNAATKLATQLVRERLKNVFPDDDAYKAFINQLDIEDDFAKTYQTTFGGSPTQPRQVGEQELRSVVSGGGAIEGQDTGTVVLNAVKKVLGKKEIPQPVIDELQRLVFTPLKDFTKADRALLKRHNMTGADIGKMKRIIESTPNALTLGGISGAASQER